MTIETGSRRFPSAITPPGRALGSEGRIAVVVPTIPGRANHLGTALQSVAFQSRQPDVVVVEFDTFREGAAAARNQALRRIGDCAWVAWLDDDDWFLPWHLEELERAARESGADVIYPYFTTRGAGDPLGWRGSPPDSSELRVHNFIPITYMARVTMIREVGGFPEPFSETWRRPHEDWGLLVRLLDAGARFHHLDRETWVWHFHREQTGGLGQAPALS
jgi:glycosyltransferase involved in cell wall biosynthesis